MTISDRNTSDVPDFYDDLDKSLDAAWGLLVAASRDRRSPVHTPVLATTGPDGAAEARTVVLRHASRSRNSVRFHTDRRSDKVAQLGRDPRCSMLAYDPEAKIQLRLRGKATLHRDDDIAEAAWSASRISSLACYAQPVGAATRLTNPREAAIGAVPDLEFARANFCAVVMSIDRIEWVYLHHCGHRRALWERNGPGWTGTWLAP